MQDLLVYIVLFLAIGYFGYRFNSTFFKKEKSCGNGSCGCE
jgi:hypothetical protein